MIKVKYMCTAQGIDICMPVIMLKPSTCICNLCSCILSSWEIIRLYDSPTAPAPATLPLTQLGTVDHLRPS